MSKQKKRILTIVGILLAVAVISIPSILLLASTSREEAKLQELQIAFTARYGTEANLLEIAEPQSLYIYVWELEEEGTTIRYFTLSINGLFVELGQVEIAD